MAEIVKVQRPLITNDPNAPWLLYDARRKHVEHIPDEDVPSHVKSGMGSDFKAYFKGAWSKDTGWKLSKRTSDHQPF